MSKLISSKINKSLILLIAFLSFFLIFNFFRFSSHKRPIVIYGDSRTGHKNHKRIVEAILKVKPRVVFHTGDLVNDGLDSKDWKIFNRITSELLTTAEFYPSMGNHENDSKLFFDNFSLPGRF